MHKKENNINKINIFSVFDAENKLVIDSTDIAD